MAEKVGKKMKIGIIGHAEDKFTEKGKEEAKSLIKYLLGFQSDFDTLVSGHCPMGGVDIWAEEVAKELNISMDLKIPKQHQWNAEYGFKQRNIDIAKDSDVLHIILVDKYPPNYKGLVFKTCYHCNLDDHIKSGACWTGKRTKELGKLVERHIIKNGT